MLDVVSLRKDFPILTRQVHGKPLVYLDSGASSQKPKQVINAMNKYYENHHSNIHRGIHALGEEATAAYEEAKKVTANFLGATTWKEIVFTKNTTEALNLLASSLCSTFKKGDEIIVSRAEHHSNFVPWQQYAQRFGLVFKIVDLDTNGLVDLKKLQSLLNKKTRIVSVAHISNVLGIVNDIQKIAALVHANKIEQNSTMKSTTLLCVDGAQSVPHMPVNVSLLDCDFLVFSAHKMLGPTGIGVLYGKKNLLEQLPPFLFGGGMVGTVTDQTTTFAEVPFRFEAGTPPIAEAVGLTAAIQYLEKIGMQNVWEHDQEIAAYALQQLQKQKDVIIYGPSSLKETRGCVVSFNLAGIHAHDVISLLDQQGIALRAGHHCAQPLHDSLCIPASVRLSGYVYTTKQEIDTFICGLDHVRLVFQ